MRTTDFMRMSHAQAAMKASDIAYENEQLRQQLAAANEEIERLKQCHLEQTAAVQIRLAENKEQLAASQASEQQLRWDLDSLISCRESLGHLDSPTEFAIAQARYFVISDMRQIAKQALALPQDTTALEAMIAKAGEVMRERVMQARGKGPLYPLDIRAIPGVTLEDLR